MVKNTFASSRPVYVKTSTLIQGVYHSTIHCPSEDDQEEGGDDDGVIDDGGNDGDDGADDDTGSFCSFVVYHPAILARTAGPAKLVLQILSCEVGPS